MDLKLVVPVMEQEVVMEREQVVAMDQKQAFKEILPGMGI